MSLEQVADFANSSSGQTAFAVTAVVIFLAAIGLSFRGRKVSVKEICVSAMLMALATALSLVAIPLPQGGSLTPCSMFFVTLIGLWFGAPVGMVAGLSYGLLQFAINPYFVFPVQVLLDYILAFGVLGLGSLFQLKERNSVFLNRYTLVIIVPMFLRLCCSTLSGVIFFAEYAGEQNVWIYSIAYNASYIVTEMVLTLILIAIPRFRYAIDHVGKLVKASA